MIPFHGPPMRILALLRRTQPADETVLRNTMAQPHSTIRVALDAITSDDVEPLPTFGPAGLPTPSAIATGKDSDHATWGSHAIALATSRIRRLDAGAENAHAPLEARLDHWVVGVTNDAERVHALLDALDLAFEHLSVHHYAAIRRRQSLGRAVGDGSLGLPGHMVLLLALAHIEAGVRMDSLCGLLVGRDVPHGRLGLVLDDAPIRRRDEADEHDHGVRVVDGDANLCAR